MLDGCSVIRLRTLVIFHDERNAQVLIAPRTPSEGKPPRQMSVDQLEQILLPPVDPAAARAAREEAVQPTF